MLPDPYGQGGFSIRASSSVSSPHNPNKKSSSVILKRLRDREPNVRNWARNFRHDEDHATYGGARRKSSGSNQGGNMFYGTKTAK